MTTEDAKPPAREPSCEHDSNQPASMCEVCSRGPRLRAWKEGWDRYRASIGWQSFPECDLLCPRGVHSNACRRQRFSRESR